MRLAILDDYQGVSLTSADWTAVTSRCDVTVFRDHIANEADLVNRLRPFDIIVAMRERTPFPRTLITALPHLKMIATTGARNDSIDTAAASQAGVVVCGTRGLTSPAAELTWGLILALTRSIPSEYRNVQEGKWQTGIGIGLRDKTLGVLGLGPIGSQVAVIGQAFGMHVVAWSQNLDVEHARLLGVRRAATLDDLLRDTDILTIHLRLSARTIRLIGDPEIRRLRRSSYIINTSRAGITDERALVTALRERKIAGAGLDVFNEEPLPRNHPYLSLDNVILTPHLGYVTKETYAVYFADVVEDVIAYLEGHPIRVLTS